MFMTNGFCRFELQNDTIVHHQIRIVIPYLASFEEYLYMGLRFTIEASILQFLTKCILIDFFQKAISQCIIDIIEGCNNTIGFFLI